MSWAAPANQTACEWLPDSSLRTLVCAIALQAEYEDIVEECQLWTKLATLEQLCAEQGLDAHGGLARGCDFCSCN